VDTYETPTSKMDPQQKAFYEALRNPLERLCKAASDIVQAGIAVVDRALPDFGWTPTGA